MFITFDIRKFIENKINQSNNYYDFVETAFDDLSSLAKLSENKPFMEAMQKIEDMACSECDEDEDVEGEEENHDYDRLVKELAKDIQTIMEDTNRRIALRICDVLELYPKGEK